MANKLEPYSQESNDSLPEEYPITLYHIYHSGPWTRSYSIHTRSDTATTLQDKFPSNSSKNRRIRKYEALDNPRYDPRTETAPYYVHVPTILDHYPHFTLHRGGTKDAPVIAFLHQPFFSRKWKLELGDFPAQPGVGRVRAGKDGTLKSDSTSKKFRSDSDIDSCNGTGDGTWGLGKREKEKKIYQQLGDGCDGPVQEKGQEPENDYKNDRDGYSKRPSIEEVILLSAAGWPLLPFSHWHNHTLYQFSWRGWAFHWQRHVHPQSKCGMSLFVWVPSSAIPMCEQSPWQYKTSEGCHKPGGEFVLLAMFGKRRVKRKVGRLEVLDTNLEVLSLICLKREAEMGAVVEVEDRTSSREVDSEESDSLADQEDWLAEKLAGFSDQGEPLIDSEGSNDAVRRRIHDVVVATAMCVIVSERRIC